MRVPRQLVVDPVITLNVVRQGNIPCDLAIGLLRLLGREDVERVYVQPPARSRTGITLTARSRVMAQSSAPRTFRVAGIVGV